MRELNHITDKLREQCVEVVTSALAKAIFEDKDIGVVTSSKDGVTVMTVVIAPAAYREEN